MVSSTLWCPSCGTEYIAGSLVCADCRVALTRDRPAASRDGAGPGGGRDDVGSDADLVEMGEYPKLHAQILRRRLESASIPVMLEPDDEGLYTIVVPGEHADFAYAVINELEVDDEVPDTSPFAYVTRLEEHLAAAGALLDELRTRLEDLEAEGKLE